MLAQALDQMRAELTGGSVWMSVVRVRLFGVAVVLAGALVMVILGVVCLSAEGRSTAPTARSVPPPPPMRIGVNVPTIATSSGQRIYANLAAHAEWMLVKGGWKRIDPAMLDREGWVKALGPGEAAARPMMRPGAPFTNLRIRCTYAGRGSLGAGGVFRVEASRDHELDLAVTANPNPDAGGWLMLQATDPQDPLRNLDCREPDMPKDLLFAPEFISYIRQFALVRFLDWSAANANQGGDWARRNTPHRGYQGGEPEGVSVEHQVELVNEAGVDGWFVLPYNADPTYVENFGRYVHDHLKPGRTAYVELGNELWNLGFPAGRQAMKEGQAEQLGGGNPQNAMLQRYAEKSRDTLAIWTRIFADNPTRLVRVVSTQNVWTETARQVLGFKDTAHYVDALATAPYVQLDANVYAPGDLDRLFADLGERVDKAIGFAAENRLIAAQYGKRYIAYEGGQHLLPKDLEFAKRIQRDPRMGALYVRYLNGWRSQVGDVMTLYAATGPISHFGAWGLREYAGQPIDETPKLKAVREFLGRR